MALFIRMAFYWIGGVLSGQGIAIIDPVAGTLTISIEDATQALVGLGTMAMTFAVSRIAKARGGRT